jgi:hypothetical protein
MVILPQSGFSLPLNLLIRSINLVLVVSFLIVGISFLDFLAALASARGKVDVRGGSIDNPAKQLSSKQKYGSPLERVSSQ